MRIKSNYSKKKTLRKSQKQMGVIINKFHSKIHNSLTISSIRRPKVLVTLANSCKALSEKTTKYWYTKQCQCHGDTGITTIFFTEVKNIDQQWNIS